MEYFAFQELFEKIFVFYTLLKYFVFLYFRYLTDLVLIKENSICQSSEILFYRTVLPPSKCCSCDLYFGYLELFCIWIICIWNKDTQQLFTNSDYDEWLLAKAGTIVWPFSVLKSVLFNDGLPGQI